MNFYEDADLENTLDNISDQISYLLLDLLRVSVSKARAENNLIMEYIEARSKKHPDKIPF